MARPREIEIESSSSQPMLASVTFVICTKSETKGRTSVVGGVSCRGRAGEVEQTFVPISGYV